MSPFFLSESLMMLWLSLAVLPPQVSLSEPRVPLSMSLLVLTLLLVSVLVLPLSVPLIASPLLLVPVLVVLV